MLIIQLIHCTERSKEDRVRETHDFLKMPSEFMNNIIIKGFKIKILITKYFKGIYKEKGFSVHTHTHSFNHCSLSMFWLFTWIYRLLSSCHFL